MEYECVDDKGYFRFENDVLNFIEVICSSFYYILIIK